MLPWLNFFLAANNNNNFEGSCMRFNTLVSLITVSSLAHSAYKARESIKGIADEFQKLQEAKEVVTSRVGDMGPVFAQMNAPKTDAKIELLKNADNIFVNLLLKSDFSGAELEDFQSNRTQLIMDQHSALNAELQDYAAAQVRYMQEMQKVLDDIQSEFDALKADVIANASKKTDDGNKLLFATLVLLVMLKQVMDLYARHLPIERLQARDDFRFQPRFANPRFANRDRPGIARDIIRAAQRDLGLLRQDFGRAREFGGEFGRNFPNNFQPRITVDQLMSKIESGKLETYPEANSLARIHGEFNDEDNEFTSIITFGTIGYPENNGQGRNGDPIIVTGSDGIDYLHAREDIPGLLTYGNRSLMAHPANARNDTISFRNDAQELYQRVYDLADHQLQQLIAINSTARAYELECQDTPAPERLEAEESLKMFITPDPNEGFTLRVFTSPTEYTDTTKASLSDTNQDLADKFQLRLDGTQQGNASYLIREVVNSLALHQRE